MNREENLPSHELLLADYATRLAKHLDGRSAAHLHLSLLRPYNRRDHHLRIAANSFDALIKAYNGELFQLANQDIIVVVKDCPTAALDEVILRVKFLFAEDPLTADEEDAASSSFCTWYDLEQDYGKFKSVALRILKVTEAAKVAEAAAEQARAEPQPSEAAPSKPLEPARLAGLVEQVRGMDMTSLICRQKICAITPNAKPRPVFNEVYISIFDLRRLVLPDVDLSSNRWLFQHLTESLDKRMLKMLPSLEAQQELSTSVNLNVSSVLSPEFLQFDTRLRTLTRKTMILELQPIDIFGDMAAFMFARDFVRERGYRVCLDGLNHLTFPLVDRRNLGLDMEKILWAQDMGDDVNIERRSQLREALSKAGAARVILARCDSSEAIDAGLALGITLFQGRYVDQLLETGISHEEFKAGENKDIRAQTEKIRAQAGLIY